MIAAKMRSIVTVKMTAILVFFHHILLRTFEELVLNTEAESDSIAINIAIMFG
jgi:uncharacterized membrane protein (DUF485 family)